MILAGNIASGPERSKTTKGQTMNKTSAIKLMNDNPNSTFGASVAAQLLAAVHGGRGGDWREWVSKYHGDTMTGSRIQRTKKRV